VKHICELFLTVLFIGSWVFGIAAAKGFWITLGCVILPPMAWIVLADKVLDRPPVICQQDKPPIVKPTANASARRIVI